MCSGTQRPVHKAPEVTVLGAELKAIARSPGLDQSSIICWRTRCWILASAIVASSMMTE